MTVLQLFAVLCLVGMNAFFSATEFSLVAVRLSRIRQLADKGDPRAKIVESLLADLGRVVSGVQVGNHTCESFAWLSWRGYVFEASNAPGRRNSQSDGLRCLLTALRWLWLSDFLPILQVVLGELVPKNLSLARAERVALLVARPFHWFLNAFSWAIDLLDSFAEKILQALGVKSLSSHTLVRSIEELQVMVQQARDRGLLPEAEVKFIQNAMELNRVQARELMVARPDMHALPANASLEDVMRMFATTQRSRIPVYQNSLDHIIGFVHIKDMMWTLLDRARRTEEHLPPADFQLKSLLRDVLIVPESKPASELLLEFRVAPRGPGDGRGRVREHSGARDAGGYSRADGGRNSR